jgi:hypothetical protein
MCAALAVLSNKTIQIAGIDINTNTVFPVIFAVVLLSCVIARIHWRTAYKYGNPIPSEARTPHPWFLLALPVLVQRFLIVTPALASGVAAEIRIKGPYGGLTFGAFAVLGTLDMFQRWRILLRERTDERGGPATLSIWLLYWLRSFRHLAIIVMLLSPLLSQWSTQLTIRVFSVAVSFVIAVALMRIAGGLIYGLIDRLGVRLGFAATNPHYPKKARRREKRP